MLLTTIEDSGENAVDIGVAEKWTTYGRNTDVFASLLSSSRAFLEEHCKITLGRRKYLAVIDKDELLLRKPIELPRFPILVVPITYPITMRLLKSDGTTVEFTDFIFSVGWVIITDYSSIDCSDVSDKLTLHIEYFGGYEDPSTQCPSDQKQAVYQLVSYFTRNPGNGVIKGPRGGIHQVKDGAAKLIDTEYCYLKRHTV